MQEAADLLGVTIDKLYIWGRSGAWTSLDDKTQL